MWTEIGGFLVCAALILVSGRKLSWYGDIIAAKSGLGRVWTGLILMATVTSLPELVIGISSVTIVHSADLAVGNVLGSCIFNLAILSMMDAVLPGQPPLLSRIAGSHVLAAAMCTILLALVGIGLVLPDEIVILGWVGITSLAFMLVYLISLRLIHSFELQGRQTAIEFVRDSSATEQVRKVATSLQRAVVWFAMHALIVSGAALFLPAFAEAIARGSGWGESFVATLFLAASSSLPEVVVCLSAARMGATDLAAGNLFGSNIFNIMLLSVSDLFYSEGKLLKDASESNTVTVFATIMMNAIAIAGLTSPGTPCLS